jgi:selenocysteine lyase/cysteine desulfurase
MDMTIDNIREYIVGIDTPVRLDDGTMRPLINFDNAATTPALKPVLDAVCRELEMYASIGRGFSQKSGHSSDLYDRTRTEILDFVGADPDEYTCFYVNNTTDGMNKLASALITSRDDVVLATRMEHHSNDLPWRERCRVVYAETDSLGRLDLASLEEQLEKNDVSFVSVTAASNVTGYINDVHRIAGLAHKHGAMIIVDGAQTVSHRQFSMTGDTDEENIDFFIFSAHKMYSPFGGGAVVGLSSVLNDHMPEFYGGGIVNIAADSWQKYTKAPSVYEAGSPNYPGIVGLSTAVNEIRKIGFDNIREHEQALMKRLFEKLGTFRDVIIYGDTQDISDRVGVVTFNFPDINSYILAEHLAGKGGVATRRGAFCAHPYVWRLMDIPEDDLRGFVKCHDANTPGMIRISFGLYNTEDEVDEFHRVLEEVLEPARTRTEASSYKPEY